MTVNKSNSKKILLIQAPFSRLKFNLSGVYPMPALGLAQLAAVLKRQGHEPTILDMPAMRGSLEAFPRLVKNKYDLYGISCTVLSLKSALELASIIIKRQPGAKVVIGGPGVLFEPRLIYSARCIAGFDDKSIPDGSLIFCYGEGEETLIEIAQQTTGDRSLEDIKGIAFKSAGEVIMTPARGYINLDSNPLPARELLPNVRYRFHPPFGLYPPVTTVEGMRGCGYGCTFCTLDKTLRVKSVEYLVEELRHLKANFGIREVYFVDPTFTLIPDRVMQLCERILSERLSLKWTCKSRVDTVNKDLLKSMAEAGCYMISYGVESGSQAVLDALNKQSMVEHSFKAIEATKKVGIRTLVYMLLGAPGEDDRAFDETLRFVQALEPDFVLYGQLLPDPKSNMVQGKVKQGLITNEDLFELYMVGDLETFMNKTGLGPKLSVINHRLFVANRAFYARPRYVLERLKKLKNHRDLVNMISGAALIAAEKIRFKDKIWK